MSTIDENRSLATMTEDVFVHMKEFRSRADAYWARDEDVVEFEIKHTPKRTSAVDVVVLQAG